MEIAPSRSPSEHLAQLDELIDVPDAEREIIRDFYQDVVHCFVKDVKTMKQEVQFIISGHLVPTLPFYLEALDKVGTVIALIAKGSSPDQNIHDWLLRRNIAKKIFTKGSLKLSEEKKMELKAMFEQMNAEDRNYFELSKTFDPERVSIREFLVLHSSYFVQEFIDPDPNKPIIFIDIGGYFCHVLKNPMPNVMGFVEDTENGLQKYQKVLQGLPPTKPVPRLISVARSQIKDSEDYNVGKAITDAVDHILRITNYTHLAESKTILVIGYGKIGSAAAKVAAEKTRFPVSICEINPVRRLKASAYSFPVVNISEGLPKADVVLCCTGNKCLEDKHISLLKHNVYIASCTSQDDEFSPTFLAQMKMAIKRKASTEVVSYVCGGKIINLLADGNSVNFIEKAVHGYFIHGVLASLLVSAIHLYNTRNTSEQSTTVAKNAEIDFNNLEDKDSESHQNRISTILMKQKLRQGPIITNFKFRNCTRGYLPRDMEVAQLKRILQSDGRVVLVGGKKYGKSQIVEILYAINNARYDIVWKFDSHVVFEEQYRLLAMQINQKIEDGQISSPKIHLDAQSVKYFLQTRQHPYLLIFEQVSFWKNVSSAVPLPTGSKREHALLTAETKLPDDDGIRFVSLQPFGTEKLLEFFVNDAHSWFANSEKYMDLAFLLAGCVDGEGAISREEKIYQAMSVICVAFDWVRYYAKLGKVTLASLCQLLQNASNANKAEAFLELVWERLEHDQQKLLSIFYAFPEGVREQIAIPCSAVASFAHLLYNSQKPISDLLDIGLIQQADTFYLPSFTGKHKVPFTSDCFTLEFATRTVVRQFCGSKGIDFRFAELVRSIAKTLTNESQSEPDLRYKSWGDQNPRICYKFFKRLASYYARTSHSAADCCTANQQLAFQYCNLAQERKRLYEKHNARLAKSNLGFGRILSSAGEYGKAWTFLKLAKEQLENLSDQEFLLAQVNCESSFVIYANRQAPDFPSLQDALDCARQANRYFQGQKLPYWQAKALNFLGICYKSKRQFAEAKKALSQARNLSPEYDVAISQNLALVYKNQGLLEDALNEFEAVRAKKETQTGVWTPEYALILRDIGMCLDRLGQFQEALRLLEQAEHIQLHCHGNNSRQVLITRVCLISPHIQLNALNSNQKQVLQDALTELKGSELRPVYKYLAEMYLSQNDYEAAKKELGKALDIEADALEEHHKTWNLLAECYLNSGETDLARSYLKQAQELDPDTAALHNQAMTFVLSARVESDHALYKKALECYKRSFGKYFTNDNPRLQKWGLAEFCQEEHIAPANGDVGGVVVHMPKRQKI